MPRRGLLRMAAFGAAGWLGLGGPALQQSAAQVPTPDPPAKLNPTVFQIACCTSAYSEFPLARALHGVSSAGFKFVSWGTTHREEDGQRHPYLPIDANLEQAKTLAQRCRDLGLEPVAMYGMVPLEQPDAIAQLTQRIRQAGAAGVHQLLVAAQTASGNRPLWVERLKQLGPVAKDHHVAIVLKQTLGESGSGKACAEIASEVNHPYVKVNYDAGAVRDALNIDPIPDFQMCHEMVRSICANDHRHVPKKQTCAPGLGEIDHYRLLSLVAHTGRKMPVCCENVFAPLLPKPVKAEEIDDLAGRARKFLEIVTTGLQTDYTA